ncbi:MAG: riboflavin synthase [candidate division Zixibacteria bacterium]|nr:riboflavin synthase [candidate division Zixibacteria bacterium]
MFTGIIEEIGEIKNIFSTAKGKVIEIKAEKVSKDLKVGDSVNINGACQTVVETKRNHFKIQAVEETLKRTNFALLKAGDRVNLERGMKLSDRLGGHLISGHIDCTSRIKSIDLRGDSSIYEFDLPAEYSNLVVDKGSIAVEGISLTITELKEDSFKVSVIPFTLKMTTLGERRAGDMVNVEFDLLGKYVKKVIEKKEDIKSKITEEWLKEIR